MAACVYASAAFARASRVISNPIMRKSLRNDFTGVPRCGTVPLQQQVAGPGKAVADGAATATRTRDAAAAACQLQSSQRAWYPRRAAGGRRDSNAAETRKEELTESAELLAHALADAWAICRIECLGDRLEASQQRQGVQRRAGAQTVSEGRHSALVTVDNEGRGAASKALRFHMQ